MLKSRFQGIVGPGRRWTRSTHYRKASTNFSPLLASIEQILKIHFRFCWSLLVSCCIIWHQEELKNKGQLHEYIRHLHSTSRQSLHYVIVTIELISRPKIFIIHIPRLYAWAIYYYYNEQGKPILTMVQLSIMIYAYLTPLTSQTNICM